MRSNDMILYLSQDRLSCHHSRQSMDASVKSNKMTFPLLAFVWSVLFVAISFAKPTVSNFKQLVQNSEHTTAVAVDEKQDKCTIVVNGNSYYAGPDKKMEALLRGIQAQLSEMEKQLLEIKPVTRKETGVGEYNSKQFFCLIR